MLTVGEIMTKDVVTVKKSTTLRELAEIFSSRRIGSVPVVADDGNLIGIVTETDLVAQDRELHIPTVVSLFDWVIYLESEKKFEEDLKKITGQTVADILTEKVETVSPATTVAEVAGLMSSKTIHAVPVLEGGKLVGIVSRIDLIRSMIK